MSKTKYRVNYFPQISGNIEWKPGNNVRRSNFDELRQKVEGSSNESNLDVEALVRTKFATS